MKKSFIILLVLTTLAGMVVTYYYFHKPIRPKEPIRSTLDSTLVLPVSTISIPIEFQLTDLERLVNTKLKGIFINEWLAVGDKKRDSIHLEMERTNPIRFSWEPGTLSAKVPLRISFRFKRRRLAFAFKM